MVHIDVNYPVLRESTIPGLVLVERGKVRDIYKRNGRDDLIIVATDRISTHDVVYDECIPHKGYGLTATPVYVFGQIKEREIVPTHLKSNPDPNVIVVERADVYPVEVIIRGIITGSAWKTYLKDDRVVCGIKLPKGLKKNQLLDKPIITPTTKARTGHDENITHAQAREIVGSVWDEIVKVTQELYLMGNSLTEYNGAMVADTKFEFGKDNHHDVVLVDEAFTHDSTRFMKIDDWQYALKEGIDPHWIDKQFVRDYAEGLGFTGDGPAPHLPPEIIEGAAKRIFGVYKILTGEQLPLPKEPPTDERIVKNLKAAGLI